MSKNTSKNMSKTETVSKNLSNDTSNKKKVITRKNIKNENESTPKMKKIDGIDSLLSSSIFDDDKDKNKKKTDIRTLSNTKVLPKKSEIVIDMEHDTADEKIEKLITLVQILQKELNDFQTYSEGTYCTYAVHNNFTSEIEDKVSRLVSDIDEIRD